MNVHPVTMTTTDMHMRLMHMRLMVYEKEKELKGVPEEHEPKLDFM